MSKKKNVKTKKSKKIRPVGTQEQRAISLYNLIAKEVAENPKPDGNRVYAEIFFALEAAFADGAKNEK